MASEDDEQSPFTRPGFLAAAVVLFLIIVGGVGVVVFGGSKDGPPASTPEPTETVTTEPEPEPSSEPDQASVCGLKGEVLEEGRISTAPEAEWDYQGTAAYPTSDEFGPGEVSDEGYRYCFQHSPEGALFMAVNAAVQGDHDSEVARSWVEYVLADGPYKEELLGEAIGDSDDSQVRMSIKGFRLLAYDGEAATVDVAWRVTGEGNEATGSGVYDLVWQDGDWKIATEKQEPLNLVQIPDLAGYIAWEE